MSIFFRRVDPVHFVHVEACFFTTDEDALGLVFVDGRFLRLCVAVRLHPNEDDD